MIQITEEKRIEELASKLLKYYSNGSLYSISGSGFQKVFEILSRDIIYQRLDDGLFLLLDNRGSISANHLDKNMERKLIDLSGAYYGLVERHGKANTVNYKLSSDIIQVLYKIFYSVQRLKEKKLEVFSIISKR